MVIHIQIIIFYLDEGGVQGSGRFEMPEEYSSSNTQSDSTVSYPSKNKMYGRALSWLNYTPLS